MPPRVLVVGVSGPSSSGKSTLTRLMRDVLPRATTTPPRRALILYEDDFYKPEVDIPVVDGVQDWDCPEAIDYAGLRAAVAHVRACGTVSAAVEEQSKEDRNELGKPPLETAAARALATRILGDGAGAVLEETLVCLVDGFLLFNDPELVKLLDVKLLLRAPYAKLKQRREARNGYATIEGFWVDPPGYFDDIVWPGYVRAHRDLFVGGDMDGPLAPAAVDAGIQVPPELDMTMAGLLEWALAAVIAALA
ncbi:P-loop containing nucleoside triphosphate hydrolase protein [Limtongia smithiae]|uniref:P-loop containing nucleoside triphosphate hydrolase protein n=1 Tax=Limtongia smithiae TaxID=1125753 RepID=UPI0034CE1644